MPPQETPSKECPDPINVLISIIKPGWKRVLFLILPAIGLIIAHFIYYSDSPSTCINIIRLCLTIITVIYIGVSIGEAYKKKSDIIDSFHKNQPQFFTIIVVLGGTLAILIPMIMNVTKLIGDGAPLTTALLGITGGIIAIFGYYKTHQKSELEREQLETQKQKDVRDHIRQLHDSYNDRFDKAVAELNSNDVKAAYTAVPKLAKLADAWLDYEDLSNDTEELEKLEKKAKKEAQTIINVLCKYIRTLPNNYTTEQLSKLDSLPDSDKKTIADETDIRRLIFAEISDRLSKIEQENSSGSLTPGIWSKFNFDFSQSPIFYPLDNLHLENSDFTESTIHKGGKFTNTKFIGKTTFFGARFKDPIDFTHAHFINGANFEKAQFEEIPNFTYVNFKEDTNFINAKFHKSATFRLVRFIGPAYFKQVHFKGVAEFTFARFENTVDFAGAHFYKYVKFEGTNFHEAYLGDIRFDDAAIFNRARFHEKVNFSSSIFNKQALFNSAYFYKYAGFNAIFNYIPPMFGREEDAAHFSIKHKCYFKVDFRSPNKINLGKAEFKGFEYRIPVNTVLFDPRSRMDWNSEYRELSEPAKPIEESDNQGDTPSK